MIRFFLLFALLMPACAWIGKRPTINGGGVSIVGVPDAGKAATLDQGETKSSLAIPAKTPVTVIRTEAIPATETTPFVPAKQEITFTPSFDTKWESVTSQISANTGTVDVSVAKHRIDVAENRYLLFAAIGAAVAAAFFVYIKYPTPAMMCGGASVVFFLAWKLADLPPWFYLIGMIGSIGAIFLWRGHERGEKTASQTSVNTPTISNG